MSSRAWPRALQPCWNLEGWMHRWNELTLLSTLVSWTSGLGKPGIVGDFHAAKLNTAELDCNHWDEQGRIHRNPGVQEGRVTESNSSEHSRCLSPTTTTTTTPAPPRRHTWPLVVVVDLRGLCPPGQRRFHCSDGLTSTGTCQAWHSPSIR
jgi:hypothetical protein